MKFTAFHGKEEAALPRYRGTVQFGYYFLTSARPGEEQSDEQRVSNRLPATYSIEENRFTGARQTHDFNHELGLALDLYMKLRTMSVIGSG